MELAAVSRLGVELSMASASTTLAGFSCSPFRKTWGLNVGRWGVGERDTNLPSSFPLLSFLLFTFFLFLLLPIQLFSLHLFASLLLTLTEVDGLDYNETHTIRHQPLTSSFSFFSLSRISRSFTTLNELEKKSDDRHPFVQ